MCVSVQCHVHVIQVLTGECRRYSSYNEWDLRAADKTYGSSKCKGNESRVAGELTRWHGGFFTVLQSLTTCTRSGQEFAPHASSVGTRTGPKSSHRGAHPTGRPVLRRVLFLRGALPGAGSSRVPVRGLVVCGDVASSSKPLKTLWKLPVPPPDYCSSDASSESCSAFLARSIAPSAELIEFCNLSSRAVMLSSWLSFSS